MDVLVGRALMDRFGIGGTRLVPLPDIATRGRVWLKAEYTNPFGSVKDRAAAYLLAWARTEGGPSLSIVESTSGNLGLALARLCSELGIRATLVMDESLPAECIDGVRRAGAAVWVVAECHDGLTLRESRIAVARELGGQAGWLWLNQYGNEAGVCAHAQTTGPEIWDGLDGAVDAVVASVGTGGTLCGIGVALREHRRRPLIVGVEPVGSTISGGVEGDYLPSGSGMRGRPEIVHRHRDLIDLFAQVPDHLSAVWTVRLRRRYGLEVGLTTGAAVAVAAMLAEDGAIQVAAIAPDDGKAFRSTIAALAESGAPGSATSQIQLRPFEATQLAEEGHRT